MQLKKFRPLIIVVMLLIGFALKALHNPSNSSHTSSHNAPSAAGYTSSSPSSTNIDTTPNVVASYLRSHHQLPDYYIRKGEARRNGWIASKGNLCQVLPGRVIGGDHFSNREHGLPERAGRNWQEADVNFSCGHRNSDRLLFSSDGLIYLTTDHYRSFQQVP